MYRTRVHNTHMSCPFILRNAQMLTFPELVESSNLFLNCHSTVPQHRAGSLCVHSTKLLQQGSAHQLASVHIKKARNHDLPPDHFQNSGTIRHIKAMVILAMLDPSCLPIWPPRVDSRKGCLLANHGKNNNKCNFCISGPWKTHPCHAHRPET